MIPSKKVEELISKHKSLEGELSSGRIDKKLFAAKSKEYQDLNEIIDQATDFYDVWNQLIERELLLCSNIKPNNWFTIDNLENLENFNKISS